MLPSTLSPSLAVNYENAYALKTPHVVALLFLYDDCQASDPADWILQIVDDKKQNQKIGPSKSLMVENFFGQSNSMDQLKLVMRSYGTKIYESFRLVLKVRVKLGVKLRVSLVLRAIMSASHLETQ